MSGNTPQKFRARLERGTHNLGWLTITIPFDPAKVWPDRNRLRVRGQIGALTFRSSLFPFKDGGYFLLVNKKMQAAANVTAGDKAEFLLEPDLEERTTTPPPELERLLKQDRALRKWYASLSNSIRKDTATHITSAKTEVTRLKRAEQLAERFLLTMEGEQQTPPILRTLFRSNPGAEQIWNTLAPSHRRRYLLAIYYYHAPESRERRAQRVLDEILNRKPTPEE